MCPALQKPETPSLCIEPETGHSLHVTVMTSSSQDGKVSHTGLRETIREMNVLVGVNVTGGIHTSSSMSGVCVPERAPGMEGALSAICELNVLVGIHTSSSISGMCVPE